MVAAHAKGYSYKEIETLFENRRQGKSFLEDVPYKASARSFVDLGKAAWEYRLKRRPAGRGRAVPGAPPGHCAQSAALGRQRAAVEVVSVGLQPDPLDDHAGRRAPLRVAAQDAVALARRRCASCRTRSSGGSSATRTATCPTTATRMQDAKLRPEDIRGQADLHKLPFLTKADVRKHLYFDIMQREPATRQQMLKIIDERLDRRAVRLLRRPRAARVPLGGDAARAGVDGLRFGDPMRASLAPDDRHDARRRRAKERVDAAFTRRKFIPVFEMTRRQARRDDASDRANGSRCSSTATPRRSTSWRTTSKSTGNVDVRPKAIMSSAQTLARRRAARSSKRPSAARCSTSTEPRVQRHRLRVRGARGHHVVAEGYIVEILRDGEPARPGEIGEVVITDLNNYCMPFIRYRIGDLAEAHRSRRAVHVRPRAAARSATSRDACSRSSRAPTGAICPAPSSPTT